MFPVLATNALHVIYIVGPVMLVAVVLAAVWLDRWSVPTILIALLAGILCGSDVLALWRFDNLLLANQIANFALVFILFHGGFSTKREDFRAVALPAGGLATWGVVLTALATFGVLHWLLKWPTEKALLLSVIISSTDAAAIFSILRLQPLPRKVASTVEIESGTNDPMAILLTVAAIGMLTAERASPWALVGSFAWKFIGGPLVGWLMARGAVWLFNRFSPHDRGHYYVLSMGVIMLVYGVAEALRTNGMLAVFIAGFVMGNSAFVHKQGVANFSTAFSTISNIGMFVMLGLQVSPSHWAAIWREGVILFLVLTAIARPVAVALGTLGMRIPRNEKLFIGWAGLRGSVPIVLATYPSAAGMEIGSEIFSLVFFAVLLSIAVQGGSLGVVARWLGLTEPMRPNARFSLELMTMTGSDLELFVIDLPGPQGEDGPTIAELPLPPDTIITLVARGDGLIAPNGSTRLRGWDQLTVLAHRRDEGEIRDLMIKAFRKPDAPARGKKKREKVEAA